MADISRRVIPGDPIAGFPADTINYVVEGARLAHRTQSGIPSGNGYPKDAGVIWVRNDSATDPLPPYSILGIEDQVVFDETDNFEAYREAATFVGVEPTEDDHEAKFCVTLEPLMSGFRGEAVAVGVVYCKVDVTDESHEFADVTEGEVEHLTSGDSGYARILRKPSGTGVLDCVVRLSGGGTAGEGTDTLTDSCECDNDGLVQGVPLGGDPTVCCTSHEQLTLDLGDLGTFNLWHADAAGVMGMSDTWSTFHEDSALDNPLVIDCSEYSESPMEDEYDVVMTLSSTSAKIELVPRDPGYENCDPICLVYERFTPFECQGRNEFRRTEWEGFTSEIGVPPKCVCVVPSSGFPEVEFFSCDGATFPSYLLLQVSDVDEVSTSGSASCEFCEGGCETYLGTYRILFQSDAGLCGVCVYVGTDPDTVDLPIFGGLGCIQHCWGSSCAGLLAGISNYNPNNLPQNILAGFIGRIDSEFGCGETCGEGGMTIDEVTGPGRYELESWTIFTGGGGQLTCTSSTAHLLIPDSEGNFPFPKPTSSGRCTPCGS